MGFTKKILVPTDFSEGSGKAVHFATAIALEHGASIELMHAFEIPSVAFLEGSMIATPAMVADISGLAQKQLDVAADQIREAGVEVSAHLLQGVAYTEITRAAQDLGCDLVVMSTHGRTGLRHALIGSVAERVVRTAPIPVLTLRPPSDD